MTCEAILPSLPSGATEPVLDLGAFLALALRCGVGPSFGLCTGDKGCAIEYVALVIGRLYILRLHPGQLPGVRVHTRRVPALAEVPGPAQLLLGRMGGRSRVPSSRALSRAAEHVAGALPGVAADRACLPLA